MLTFPQKISLEQKYTHHVVDVHDVRSLQQFLPLEIITLIDQEECKICENSSPKIFLGF